MNCPALSPARPSSPDADTTSFPEYTHPNVLPPAHLLPDFAPAFSALTSLIISTAALVAAACDRYAEREIPGYTPHTLEAIVRQSSTTKARLLHYYPPPLIPTPPPAPRPPPPLSSSPSLVSSPSLSSPTDNGDNNDDNDDGWCATHLDHGCLTGLTSAFYTPELPPLRLDQSPASTPILPELPHAPDPTAGLYIRSRTGATVKVDIPRDSLAFQTGEALEIITRGKFRAVPHFVRGAKNSGSSGDDGDGDGNGNGNGNGRGVARNTLAVFTQPDLGVRIDEEGRTFAQFAREVVGRNRG
jgi:hypothetical protein